MSNKKPADKKKRILIVDDHAVLREGIAKLINEQPDLVVCGEAGDRESAQAVAQSTQPDVAIMDISLKDQSGLELIKDFRAQFPDMMILALSVHDESIYGERALRAGARGYVMKREAWEKVLQAIHTVLNGKVFASDKVTASIMDNVTGYQTEQVRSSLDVLSDREMEVFKQIGKGYGPHQIAKQLNMSSKTVESHRANIKRKLDLASGRELLQRAIAWAQQMGDI